MNYIFYSYYISLLLKGKLKAVEISLAAMVAFLVVLFYIDSIIGFITGCGTFLPVVLFIYSLMNLGYAVFNGYIPVSAHLYIRT